MMDTEFIQQPVQPVQSVQPVQPAQPAEPQQSGLSLTSFILSIIGWLLCMTVIGALIGIPLAILGLIFGIFALAYKQKKGLAITGIILGGIITLCTATALILGAIFWNNNKDVILEPMKEFTQMMKDDPQIALTMQDPRFQADFQTAFRSNLSGKINEDTVKTREDMRVMIPTIYEEMASIILELKDKYAATGFQTGSGILMVQTGSMESGGIDLPRIEIQTGITTSGTVQLPGNEVTTCKVDADCIPLPSACHATSCINKTFESKYTKPEMCTMMFVIEAAYSPKDCACQNNVCTNKNLGNK